MNPCTWSKPANTCQLRYHTLWVGDQGKGDHEDEEDGGRSRRGKGMVREKVGEIKKGEGIIREKVERSREGGNG